MTHVVPTSADGSRRILGLDVLRASAILMVTLSHGFALLYPHVSWLGVLGHGGFVGVELFFVLSGFLIGQILIRAGDGLAQGGGLGLFYVRRWFRTLPLFWLLLMVNVLLDRWLDGTRYPPGEVVAHGLFLRNFTTMRLAFVPESWSLAVEEWFYLLFPAALWLGLKLKARFDTVLIVSAMVFYGVSTYLRVSTAMQPGITWDWQRTIVTHRFDAIMTGIIAAWIAVRFPAAWRKSAGLAACIGMLLVLGMYSTLWRRDGAWIASAPDSAFAQTWRFNLVSLGFALLLPLAAGWTVAKENMATISVRSIALWSYAIYLVQHPFSRWAMHTGFQDWPKSAPHAWLLFGEFVLGTIAVSALLHYTFEAPCTRLRERVGARLGRS